MAIEGVELVLTLIAVAIIPIAITFTLYAWRLAFRYYPYGFRLPLIKAIVNSIATGVALWFGFLVWMRLQGTPITAPYLNAVFVLLLLTIPFFTTGYLIWLDRRRGRSMDQEMPIEQHEPSVRVSSRPDTRPTKPGP